jgi:UDP-N-acetyl-D-mannosaminuronic acid dehydrogenase
VDVWEAISLANLHPRINILNPGPGVGGHCISVDPWFFVEAAPELSQLIYQARAVNDSQPQFVVEKVRQVFSADATGNSLNGKKIAALGLAYKPDVDDLRESPATEVVHLLQREGARVKAWEPFKPEANMPGIDMSPSLAAALEDADVILLLVNHTEFRQLIAEEIAKQTCARLVLDTVNAWSSAQWQDAGFKVFRLGVRK